MKYAVFGFLILSLSSCSKTGSDKSTPGIPEIDSCNQVVQVNFYNVETRITYDAAGRIIDVVGEAFNHSAYTYFKDSIRVAATDVNGVDISTTYYLNEKGFITGTSFFDYRYTYDDSNRLISYRSPYSTGFTPGQVGGYVPYNLYYQDGNLIELSTTDRTVSRQKVSLYYSDTAYQNVLGYTSSLAHSGVIFDRNTIYLIGEGFFGTQNRTLCNALDIHDGRGAGSKIDYGYDAKGRITSMFSEYFFVYRCE